MTRFGEIAAAIEQAQLVSSAWQGKITQDPASRERATGWMPYNLFEFGMLLLECYTWAPGNTLLEIGCGPGPNMMLARALGWKARGIEINDQMAAEARAHGFTVYGGDAARYPGYGNQDAVWFNRVFRDRELQAALERTVWEEMAPGAVAICANLEAPPPPSWWIVNDSWGGVEGLRRGVWAKPGATPAG